MARFWAGRLWLGSLLICTWAASARADECSGNEDCPKGYSCQASSGAAECDAAPACESGAKCPQRSACESPTETRTCQPASCSTDDDCGTAMVCFREMFTECGGSGATPTCPAGEACELPAPDEPVCSERAISLCVPRYVLPCEQDANCGEGFSCVAGEECSCSGSAGFADAGTAVATTGDGGVDFGGFAPAIDAGAAPAVDGGAAPAVDGGKAPDCECRPTERKHCELNVLSCSTDADCPSDLVCKPYGDSAVSCSSSEAGAAQCDSEPIAPTQLRCAPRYEWPGRGGVPGSSGEDPSYEHGSADGGIVGAPSDDDTGATSETSTCSVSTPGAGQRGSLAVPLALMMLGLAARTRRKLR